MPLRADPATDRDPVAARQALRASAGSRAVETPEAPLAGGRLDTGHATAPQPVRSARLDLRTLVAVAAFQTLCLAIATYPFVQNFHTRLPGSLTDPLQHLWLLRWYRTCLAEGRLPLVCPEIQYPVGAAIGNFSPLHLQALLYLPLSALLDNDVLCFNLMWLTGMLLTGMGTFVLLWRVLDDRACAAFGGVVAMLSGPMLQHAQAHLELVYLGAVPLFLAAWIDLLDRPSARRLASAAGLYVLVALCAAYYAVLVTVPASLYVICECARALRARERGYLRARVGWLAAFAAVTTPIALVLFANQMWARSHGYMLDRSLYEFRKYGAPLWTYIIPTSQHALSAILPVDVYRAADFSATTSERSSYLGIMTLLLIHHAARRARIPRAAFWWTALGVLALLACGALWQFGRHPVPLPAVWLRWALPGFRQVRVPARFNLLVAIVAALLAAAGLRELLRAVESPARRAIVWLGATTLVVLDLAIVPFPTVVIPPLPPGYSWFLKSHPDAAFLEVPAGYSSGSYLSPICAYWQAQHRGRTSAGYSGQGNVHFDNLVTRNSPFRLREIEMPGYLADADGQTLDGSSPSFCDIVAGARFRDYAWLFLTVHGYDAVVLHQWRDAHFGDFDRAPLKQQLAPALVYEDALTAIYDCAHLPLPAQATPLLTHGWRPHWIGQQSRVAGLEAHVAVYNPDPDRALALTLDASAFRRRRFVRLLNGSSELARWPIVVGSITTYRSPPFHLPRGISDLRLMSDGEDPPRSRKDAAWETDLAPYSYRITRLRVQTAP